jgi:hypothetical protein
MVCVRACVCVYHTIHTQSHTHTPYICIYSCIYIPCIFIPYIYTHHIYLYHIYIYHTHTQTHTSLSLTDVNYSVCLNHVPKPYTAERSSFAPEDGQGRGDFFLKKTLSIFKKKILYLVTLCRGLARDIYPVCG